MRDVLQGLLIASVAAWVMFVLALLWMRHRVRRRLRIVPEVRSSAPTVWLVAPTSAARLHHRLRRVGASAQAASTLDPALTDLAGDLIAEAVALEPAVVSARGTGRTGSSVRRRLAVRVSELESVAQHLTAMSTEPSSGAGDAIRLRDRVAALEAARQELTDVELRAGLYSHA